jgi:hypothetical protein
MPHYKAHCTELMHHTIILTTPPAVRYLSARKPFIIALLAPSHHANTI